MFSSAPIIKARQNWFVVPFFKWYTILNLKFRFHKVYRFSNYADEGKSLLILCNHMSWWDGFWVNYWNTRSFKRKFYFMMLEEQLRKNRFFQFTGGFSINPSSRSLFHSLSFCSNLLRNSSNMVLLFPQGEIKSAYDTDFEFRRGLRLLLQQCDGCFQILLMANFVEFGSSPKPSLYSYVKGYNGSLTSDKIEEEYKLFYNECLTKQVRSV